MVNDLEQRLRSALTDLAEEVPPSRHAWADQERRLALKSVRDRRRPALMAAAAAAVVALIAVPVLVLKLRPVPLEAAGPPPTPTIDQSDTGPPPVSRNDQPVYAPAPGEEVLVQPVLLLGRGNGRPESIYAYSVARNGKPLLCIATKAEAAGGKQVELVASDSTLPCVPAFQPKGGKVVWLQYGVTSLDIPGVYVYLASKPTSRLLVRQANGTLAVAEKRGTGPAFDLFITFLNSDQPPTAYTAKDQANVTLEDGP